MSAALGAECRRPIVGVFDSGFGGLTVLRELLVQVPGADFVYLGDTAHLPYGSKSQAAVTRYTAAAIGMLVSHGANLVVVACNTASALALPALLVSASVPLVGVIGPGAQAAAVVAPSSTVLILATEGTVNSHAYAQACAEAGLNAVEKACPLFVPLVEEGWIDGKITEQIAAVYLREALQYADALPSAIVLGCTHYPLLRPLLQRTVQLIAGAIPILDAAEATARHVATLLPGAATSEPGKARLNFFEQLGPRFLGCAIDAVQLVDLGD